MPARASTDLEVANLALTFCKEDAISSFDEADRTAARACKTWYGTELENTLACEPWDFATAYDRPAADPTLGLGTLKNRFPMRPDCVNVRAVVDANGQGWDWAIENGTISIGGASVEAKYLVTNLAAPIVCYTRRVEDIAVWTTQAVTAFAVGLAKRVAPLIGRSNQLSKWLKDQAADEKEVAQESNAREQSRGQISRDTSWTRARFTGLPRG